MKSKVLFPSLSFVCTAILIFQLVFSCTRCSKPRVTVINEQGNTLATRYPVPQGTRHIFPTGEKGFAHYLLSLPLQPAGSKVHYYDGTTKNITTVYDGVVDMEIGTRDLQQCADAIMRLRSEYFYARQQYDRIHFNFTSGFRADYSKWKQGYRIQLNGNDAQWVKTANPANDRNIFRQYLDMVFTYAGTLSLSREMKSVSLADMQAGDVLIHGALPGHCNLVVAMAQDTVNGKKYFMLAESSTPAQEIQILLNPHAGYRTVWCELDTMATEIRTSDYIFASTELMRFVE